MRGLRYVLVVDDDPTLREVVIAQLRAEGIPAEGAANSLEALELAAAHGAPSLVLLDLTMPVMDGRQFLAERRKWRTLISVPLVVMTAAPDAKSDGLLTAGAVDVLIKPFSSEELVSCVLKHRVAAGSTEGASGSGS